MIMRKLMMVAAGVVLCTTPLAATAASAHSSTKVVKIKGEDSFKANRFFLNTYRFAPGQIHVHQGDQVTFVNTTTDSHTMTLVVKADLPSTVAQINTCPVCDAVNGVYFPGGAQQPAGVQIDNGKLTDGTDHDADAVDPAVPPGVPFKALTEDFDTPSHANGASAPTVGDSTLIGAAPKPDQRTIVVTAPPGTVLHYFCTFHPWMQGTIVVDPRDD